MILFGMNFFLEINRVRVAIFQCEFTGEPLQLPEPMGEVTVHQKKVFVPVKQYPEVTLESSTAIIFVQLWRFVKLFF